MSSLHISQDLENKIKTIKVNNSDNSTKWNNFINDLNTENTSDSLIPVITNEGSMQHTTIPNLVSRGNPATTSTNGIMSSEDKTNLNRATSNRTLWSGAWYMHGTQQAYLSETVSSQPTGIVLIWSGYDNGEAKNYNYRSTFVPKQFVSLHNGSISVKSKENEGSEFVINLPINLIEDKELFLYDSDVLDFNIKTELSDIYM